MTTQLNDLSIIFNLNERLFLNALDGITEEQASERISPHNNPVNWIATHTVWARYNMLLFLGKPAANPYQGMFENFIPYDPIVAYPSLESIKEEWKKASSLLNGALQSVTAEHLTAQSPIKAPIADPTNRGTLAFLAQHESYDIGQIGLLKKYLTNEAMKYS